MRLYYLYQEKERKEFKMKKKVGDIYLLPWENNLFVGRLVQNSDTTVMEMINLCQVFLMPDNSGKLTTAGHVLGKMVVPKGVSLIYLTPESLYYQTYVKLTTNITLV